MIIARGKQDLNGQASPISFSRSETPLGELVNSIRGAAVGAAGNGRLGEYRNGAQICPSGTESFD